MRFLLLLVQIIACIACIVCGILIFKSLWVGSIGLFLVGIFNFILVYEEWKGLKK